MRRVGGMPDGGTVASAVEVELARYPRIGPSLATLRILLVTPHPAWETGVSVAPTQCIAPAHSSIAVRHHNARTRRGGRGSAPSQIGARYRPGNVPAIRLADKRPSIDMARTESST